MLVVLFNTKICLYYTALSIMVVSVNVEAVIRILKVKIVLLVLRVVKAIKKV